MKILSDAPWRRKMLFDDNGQEKSAEQVACTEARINQTSEQIFENLASGKDDLVKQAESLLNDFIPARIREESFLEIICPSEQVQNNELDRAQEHEVPQYIIDMEDFTPAAMTVPFNTGLMGSPEAEYVMNAKRIKGAFNRIKTRTFVKDIDLFRTWRHDMQQVFGDNAVRDIMVEMDAQLIRGCQTMLVGLGVVLPASGIPQWIQVGGAISRASLNPAFDLLYKTPAQFPVATVLSNIITMNQFTAWGRDEVGGDLAQDLFTKGISALPDIHGKKWISTIKRGLVPDFRWHLFAANRFTMRHKFLTAPTMHIETKNLQVRMWIHTTRSLVLCNQNALGIVDFTASY